MRVGNRLARFPLALVLVISAGATVMAQQPDPAGDKTRPRVTNPPPAAQEKTKDAAKKPAALPTGERLEPDDSTRTATDVPAEMQANRQEQLSEDAEASPQLILRAERAAD